MEKDTRKEQRRYNSACAVIDSAFETDSRVVVVRVDLSYREGKSSAQRINSDLNRLMLNARSKPSIFKHQIGYIMKLEKGNNDNYHAHALFTFRGHNVRNHIYKADQLGKYWRDTITKGDGLYFNCNIEKYDKYCIGTIHRNDTEAINALKETAVSFLCKDEQSTKNSDGSDKKAKEFRCSVVKKKK